MTRYSSETDRSSSSTVGTTPVFSYSTPLCTSSVASPPSSRIMFGPTISPDASRNLNSCSVAHQYSASVSPFQANTGTPFGCSGVPCGPTTAAAAAWSCVEKMLQDTQRTSAPRLTRVSISTAVCTVMCSEPATRAPCSGRASAYSRRSSIRPGISCSASRISLRPNSASDRSATAKSIPPSSWKRRPAVSGAVLVTSGMVGVVVMGSGPPRRARCGPGRTYPATTPRWAARPVGMRWARCRVVVRVRESMRHGGLLENFVRRRPSCRRTTGRAWRIHRSGHEPPRARSRVRCSASRPGQVVQLQDRERAR